MQKLKIYQSLWGMEQRHPKDEEPSDEAKFTKIKTGGFDGVCIDLTVDEVEEFKSIQPLFKKNELECMVNAFPYHLDELNPILDLAKEFNACFVNIIGGVMPIDYKDGIPVVRRWMDDANKAEVEILFETHRDSLLNDLIVSFGLNELINYKWLIPVAVLFHGFYMSLRYWNIRFKGFFLFLLEIFLDF